MVPYGKRTVGKSLEPDLKPEPLTRHVGSSTATMLGMKVLHREYTTKARIDEQQIQLAYQLTVERSVQCRQEDYD